MKAMLIRHYGGPEVFEAGEVEPPRPGPGEILVRVRGSSVNPVDTAIRSGMLRLFVRLGMPAVLGVDVAGEVVERGAGANRFAIGDRVLAYTGLSRPGGYGELVALPESYFARVPSKLSWAEAGTIPGVGATAYEAFTVHAPLRPGMRVFINGGAGGVGTYAIQIAKAMGAEVTVTASGGKAAFVRDLGADHVIDYKKTDPFAQGAASYDVVLNAVRGPSLSRARKLLRPGGVLVTLTGIPPQAVWMKLRNLVSSRKTVIMFVSTSGTILEGLAKMIEEVKVRPIVEKTYSWNELAEAHRRVESKHVTGKLAVVPPEPGGAA
jgi:NADPH:quinone reductase-like Zn-dependent oxidoreductase